MHIHWDDLESTVHSLGKRFDLIAMDPFHEYEYSCRAFHLMYSFLSDRGRLVCHDCFPPRPSMAVPAFTTGAWCGETYLALIEFASRNPHLYYGVLNVDTGIGIVSKIDAPYLSNRLDREKQAHVLSLPDASKRYSYFREHSVDLIHAMHR
jgi:hypothetical protein